MSKSLDEIGKAEKAAKAEEPAGRDCACMPYIKGLAEETEK